MKAILISEQTKTSFTLEMNKVVKNLKSNYVEVQYQHSESEANDTYSALILIKE